jgi:hypothetical protein
MSSIRKERNKHRAAPIAPGEMVFYGLLETISFTVVVVIVERTCVCCHKSISTSSCLTFWILYPEEPRREFFELAAILIHA